MILDELAAIKSLLKFENKGALTAKEAMEYLSVGRNTLQQLADNGLIKAIPLGDHLTSKKIYPIYSLNEFLENSDDIYSGEDVIVIDSSR